MKVQIWLFAACALWLGCASARAAQQAEPAAPNRLIVTIDTTQAAAPISPYLYGGFIEHGGALIYRSLWSEMLDYRKFYFPITSKEPASTRPTQGGGAFRNMRLRTWRPIGPDEVVVMDKDQPFAGEQSPRIQVDASTPHGIRHPAWPW